MHVLSKSNGRKQIVTRLERLQLNQTKISIIFEVLLHRKLSRARLLNRY